ncbi:MAG TPA: hypothetical protein VFN26_19780 [Candidatus Acidoferrum sp.]|nr:hypothetical protein [Candidatus Acidoferrum sp.]
MAPSELAAREPRRPPLQPERLDSQRSYYDRDRTYLLRESELRSLAEIGTFRVVTPGDLAKYAYGGDAARMERDVRRLKQASLLTDKTIEISRKKTLRVLALTKQGHRLLRKTGRLPEEQTIYHGLVKPKEAEHDAALYHLYQKEAARIERAGGRPLRVVLDYELKRDLNRELVKVHGQEEGDESRERIAERHGLQVIDGKIPLPDLRIEYANADLEPRHVDLDLVTRDYRPRQVSEKARAGFSLYSPTDDAPRLRRILNDRELIAEILSL